MIPTLEPNLTEQEAAAYLRTTRRTLRNLRRQAQGPIYARVGRRVIYRLTDLQNWQAAQSTSTPAHGASQGDRP